VKWVGTSPPFEATNIFQSQCAGAWAAGAKQDYNACGAAVA
jgi:hypothetical protein